MSSPGDDLSVARIASGVPGAPADVVYGTVAPDVQLPAASSSSSSSSSSSAAAAAAGRDFTAPLPAGSGGQATVSRLGEFLAGLADPDPQPAPGSPAAAAAVFSYGRAGDGMNPGPVLCGLLHAAASGGLEALTDDQLTSMLRGFGRQVASGQARYTHALPRSRLSGRAAVTACLAEAEDEFLFP